VLCAREKNREKRKVEKKLKSLECVCVSGKDMRRKEREGETEKKRRHNFSILNFFLNAGNSV